MANIDRRTFARGLSGVFGDLFVTHQTFSGKTIITNQPLFDDHRDRIEALKPQQSAVLEATTYATFAKTQELYLQKELETGLSAYSLAVADWFGTPKILQIDLDRWTGKPGETIRVKARDNVAVARVALVIRDADGNVLEIGEAAQTKAGSAWWCYTTRSAIELTPFPSVQAIAEDHPGNCNSFTIH